MKGARLGLPALLVLALFAVAVLGQAAEPGEIAPVAAEEVAALPTQDPLAADAANPIVQEEAGPAAAADAPAAGKGDAAKGDAAADAPAAAGAEAPAPETPAGAEDVGSAANGTETAAPAEAPAAEAPAADANATEAANGTVAANGTDAADAAAPTVEVPPVETARWTFMVNKIKDMEAVCRKITERWECNSGNQICTWDGNQNPPCVVPEPYVKARLIEAAPCSGSLMEGWFNCQAANNDKEACAAKSGCTWTPWGNYTSLPLPSRKLLAYDPEGNPGACQLTEVYKMRASEEWDALSTLSFQISHLDPEVWGRCPTVAELKGLVPQSSRANCTMSRTNESCAIAAPFCSWTDLPTDPKATLSPGHKMWPTSACVTTCNTTDRATCEKHRSECVWSVKEAACSVNDGDADAVDPDAPAPRPQRPETALPPAAHAPETCVTCSAESTIGDAAFTLIQMTRTAQSKDTEDSGSPADAAHRKNEPSKLRNSASGRAAAGFALSAAAAALLLLL